MRYSVPIVLSFTILLFSSTVHAAGVSPQISQGAMLSNSCSACHGTDGKSPGAIPSINGKSARFINQALSEYRSGTRASTVMGRHAKGYSDEEIKLIADYFSNLK